MPIENRKDQIDLLYRVLTNEADPIEYYEKYGTPDCNTVCGANKRRRVRGMSPVSTKEALLIFANCFQKAKGGARVEEAGPNVAVAEYTSDKPTLDGLFRECKLDKEDWIVEKAIPTTYKVPMKVKKNGEHKALIVTLNGLRAVLRRRNPEPVNFPPIQPIVSSYKFDKVVASKKSKNDVRRALILPDAHIGFTRDPRTGALSPFHDRRALTIALKMAQAIEFDKIVILGDWLDLPDWSDKFVRRPDMQFLTQAALNECHYWLKALRFARPRAEISFIPGNHEERMSRAIMTNLAAAYGLMSAEDFGKTDEAATSMSLRKLLGLDSLGIRCAEEYPNGEVWLGENLVCVHGDKAVQGPGDTAKAVLSSARASCIFGHIHRAETATKTLWRHKGPVTYMAHCPGCLCRIDGVVPAKSKHQNWSQGFSVVDYTGDGYFHITPVAINDGVAIAGGVLVSGAEYKLKSIEKCVGFAMEPEPWQS